jgi:hypothetical protein
MTKGGLGGMLKGGLKGLGRLGGAAIGPALAAYDMYSDYKEGKFTGRSIARGIGSVAGGLIGGAAGSFVAPGVGTMLGGAAGAYGGEKFAEGIYDLFGGSDKVLAAPSTKKLAEDQAKSAESLEKISQSLDKSLVPKALGTPPSAALMNTINASPTTAATIKPTLGATTELANNNLKMIFGPDSSTSGNDRVSVTMEGLKSFVLAPYNRERANAAT